MLQIRDCLILKILVNRKITYWKCQRSKFRIQSEDHLHQECKNPQANYHRLQIKDIRVIFLIW